MKIVNDLQPGEPLYCGPAVLCSVLGLPASEVKKILVERGAGVGSRNDASGLKWEVIRDVLYEKQGLVLRAHSYRGPVKLVERYVRGRAFHCIGEGAGHYIVTSADDFKCRLADTGHLEPVLISEATRLHKNFINWGFKIFRTR